MAASLGPTTAIVVEGWRYGSLNPGETVPSADLVFAPTINASASLVTFRVQRVSTGETWTVVLGAPSGQALQVGTYAGATPAGGTSPELNVSSYSNGSTQTVTWTSATFTIEDLTTSGVDASLATLAATATLTCPSTSPCPSLELRYDSTIGWAMSTVATDYVAGPYLSFTIPAGQTALGHVTIASSGTSALMPTGFSISGSPAFTLVGDTCTGASIPPGSSCVLTVDYSPQGNSDLASLSFSDNSALIGGSIQITGATYASPPLGSASTMPGAATGIAFGGSADGCVAQLCLPAADPSVAVGPANVMEATNISIRVSDRNGTLLAEVGLGAFFADSAGQVLDGEVRVVWDPLHSRWLATEMSSNCVHGFLALAVSDTADPAGTWSIWTWQLETGMLAESPAIGYSNDKIALAFVKDLTYYGYGGYPAGCTDNVPWGGHAFIVDASVALNPAATTLPTVDFGIDNGGTPVWHVAQNLTPGSDLQLLGEVQEADLAYFHISGTVAANNVTLSPGIDVMTSGPMISPRSWPLTSHYGDPAPPVDVFWQNGRLWTALGNGCTPAGEITRRSCLRLLGLTTGGAAPGLIEDAVYGWPQEDVAAEGLALTGDGGIVLTWSTAATYLGAITSYASYQGASDPAGTLRTPIVLSQGTVPYPTHDWGTYLAAASDPLDPHAAWVPVLDTTSTGDWSSRVVQIAEAPPAKSTYFTLTPNRIVDSRIGLGVARALTSRVPATFQVTGRSADPSLNVPANATAVTGNLTVTQQTTLGYLALGPIPVANPSTSTLNFPVGDNRANAVTVPLGSGGTLSVTFAGLTGATAQVIFDVTGYFVPGTTGATYVPVTPNRLVDSRPRTALGLASSLKTGTPATFAVVGQSTDPSKNVPSSAIAVTGNLTVTDQTSLGYFALGPTPQTAPSTSTLNFPVGDNRANAVTVPLSLGGTLSVTFIGLPGATADVIFDVTGYFLPGTTGSSYYPLTPNRIVDSRPAAKIGLASALASGKAQTFQATGRVQSGPSLNVPSTAVGIVGNLTVTGQTSLGYLSLTPQPTNAPTTSTLNFPKGDNRANAVTMPLGTGGTLSVTFIGLSGATTNVVFDVDGYFAP